MGHVNNAVYFSYYETVRIKFSRQVGQLKQGGMIMAEACCSYKSPALLGEYLIVSTGVSRFGNKSFDMVYRIETDAGRLVATGKSVQVMYNYQAEETVPIPTNFKDCVLAFQGDWQAHA